MLSKLTFESENLEVDWIGFNIQGLLNQKQLEIIANYLFQNFEFNSTFAIGFGGRQENLLWNSKNKYQVSFRAYKYADIYWEGVKIDFSGQNGYQFYNLIVANQVDWEIFNLQQELTLSRLDLCYTCNNNKMEHKRNFASFLERCYQKVGQNKFIQNVSLQNNHMGSILKIGKRGSPNYYRLYQKDRQIRFELEQRGPKIKFAQDLLNENQIEIFEQIMTRNFFKYSKKVLAMDENYTDWLVDYFRRQNKNQKSFLLATGYFKDVGAKLNNIDKKKIFFRFLQFISFSKTQTVHIEFFREQPYCIFHFKASDFMDFIKVNNKNHYQREQLIKFFQKLQTMNPLVKLFTNNSFQSFTIIPYVKTRKEFDEYGPWVIEVAILQEFYQYSYRFFFPTYFITYQLDFELQIKLQFIQSYSCTELTKSFYPQKILDQYKGANNKKKSDIKLFIKSTFYNALKHKMIEDNCQIKFKNKKRKTRDILIHDLTPLLIGQSYKIHFFEKI
ncbi:hypothetical protein [uncultured Eudoraea sp.]|jgi:hypothetical protein|uniref:hypothetical protein n=1 Tax=uncultured Eudoraea sp. TaxID=1035614 RepID=UPI002616F5EB|nr:hypothetical protein [uncultured Eudoraea sp.]